MSGEAHILSELTLTQLNEMCDEEIHTVADSTFASESPPARMATFQDPFLFSTLVHLIHRKFSNILIEKSVFSVVDTTHVSKWPGSTCLLIWEDTIYVL